MPQDLQALHRRRLPAHRVGPLLRRRRRQGQVPGQRQPRLAQGRPRRRRGGRGRRSPAGRAGRRTTAARCSTASPRCSRTGATSSWPSCAPPRASPPRRRAPTSTPRSTAGSGTPAGPTRSPRSSAAPTRSPARTSTSPRPSRPAWSRSSRRTGPLLGLVCVVAPVHRHRQHRRRVASEPHPLTAITLAEVLATSDVPGGVVNVLTGPQAELAPWLASHLDVNALDLTGVGRPRARPQPGDRGRREPQARPPARASRTSSPRPPLDRMTTFLETKTVWHPMGV